MVYSQYGEHGLYEGILFERSTAREYLETCVSDKFYDTEGAKILEDIALNIGQTEFDANLLKNVISTDLDPLAWRIGECMAECFLENQRAAKFYYNSSRDKKNQRANLAGADLVGFIDLDGKTTFLFGEVKTSGSKESPPPVMYGESGMTSQLENIKNISVRYELIRWMAYKIHYADNDLFKKDFEEALKNHYPKSQGKMYNLVGVLVRDIEPSQRDLKRQYETFKVDPEIFLTLYALYLPISIY